MTGVEASALVDNGASHSFVSAKFTEMTRLPIQCDLPMAAHLPTNRSETTDCVLYLKLLIEYVIY